MIVALARPQWGFTWQEATQRGLDIVVAIDTSKSMLAEDIAPNRLARAKLAALDLMQEAKADRLGLVAFAGDAFLECPLTVDDTAFRESVAGAGRQHHAAGRHRYRRSNQDGAYCLQGGSPLTRCWCFSPMAKTTNRGALKAAKEAAKAGLRIFTVGIGTPQGDLLRVTDANGNSDYIRDAKGNVVKSHLNESLLRKIATATPGGFYIPLRGANAVETLYEKGIAPLPKTEAEQRLVKHYKERFYWPLGAAILLLLTEMFLPERKRIGPAAKDYFPGERSRGTDTCSDCSLGRLTSDCPLFAFQRTERIQFRRLYQRASGIFAVGRSDKPTIYVWSLTRATRPIALRILIWRSNFSSKPRCHQI